ncbi:MAG TPA: Crp/Fnr family transcriptional regulator [Rhizomicrobium sp.]|nr:Crp/Fnr family transcriptional regulator [Rhizomicrobium sp.]
MAKREDNKRLIAAAMRATALFSGWPQTEFETVRDSAELWRFAKGEIVAQRGDPAKGLWLVAQGSLTSYRDSPGGRYTLIGILWPGSGGVMGVLPMLDDQPMPLSHAAREDSLVVLFPRGPLQATLRRGGAPLDAVIRFQCVRSRIEYEATYNRIADTMRCQLAKLMAFLPRKSMFWAEVENPAPVDVSQDEIGAMLGLSRQTVNKLMTPLLRDGILERNGHSVRVASFKRLLEIIEEDEQLPESYRTELLSWDEKGR